MARFGFEHAFSEENIDTNVQLEERVRLTHVLLQLVNSKIKDEEFRREAEVKQQKLYDEIKALKSRLVSPPIT